MSAQATPVAVITPEANRAPNAPDAALAKRAPEANKAPKAPDATIAELATMAPEAIVTFAWAAVSAKAAPIFCQVDPVQIFK